jgi:hypothetical protein
MKTEYLLISILEATYVVYILNYFKTRYSLSIPVKYDNNYLVHPIGKHDYPKSNICKFGHDMSWFVGLYLIIKGYLFSIRYNIKKIISLNKLVIFTIFLFSLLNLNAVVYLLPIFIIEIMMFMK